jgi:hypothetical protein
MRTASTPLRLLVLVALLASIPNIGGAQGVNPKEKQPAPKETPKPDPKEKRPAPGKENPKPDPKQKQPAAGGKVEVKPAGPARTRVSGRICYSTDQKRDPRDDSDGDAHYAVECGGDDCDDKDREVHPGAIEVCDAAGRDEDCHPRSHGGQDEDGDGFEDAGCCNPGNGDRECGIDCDDRSRGVHPTATEVCNRVDDDCDGDVDESLEMRVYRDADRDLFGAAAGSSMVCPQNLGPGWVFNDYDCDDRDPRKNPWHDNCP